MLKVCLVVVITFAVYVISVEDLTKETILKEINELGLENAKKFVLSRRKLVAEDVDITKKIKELKAMVEREKHKLYLVKELFYEFGCPNATYLNVSVTLDDVEYLMGYRIDLFRHKVRRYHKAFFKIINLRFMLKNFGIRMYNAYYNQTDEIPLQEIIGFS